MAQIAGCSHLATGRCLRTPPAFSSVTSAPCWSLCRAQPVQCKAVSADDAAQQHSAGRRATLLSLAAAALWMGRPLAAVAGEPQTVGSYLPFAGVEDFVEFVPDKNKTPAIRAGTVDKLNPYRFALPPTWREGKVANIKSGNYCQPKCGEPWTEVIFEDKAEGKAEVIVSPLVRLTNQAEAKIEDIGTPPAVLQSLGPFITGTYLDDEDVVAMDTKSFDGRTYYLYEINAPYGTTGPHTISAVTTKGDLALLFVLSATDKQWAKSQGKLKKLVETFRA